MLFNPLKTDTKTRDQHHVDDVYNIAGKFDKQMIKKSPRKAVFSNLFLTGMNNELSLENLVINSTATTPATTPATTTPAATTPTPAAHSEKLLLFVDFLKQTLVVNGNKRPTVSALRNHAFVI